MAGTSDFYNLTYRHFADPMLAEIRRETFGRDIGQNSWLTAEELEQYIGWLELDEAWAVLDVACGSGGPALFASRVTGCRVTGLDTNEANLDAARGQARELGLEARVRFQAADASKPLPFADGSFTAVICIDAINHLPGRLSVLREWRRVLSPGGLALFTDPIILTGIVSNEEIAIRSSIGYFLFAPPGEDERLIAEAGLELVRTKDMTGNNAAIPKAWHAARARRREELVKIEGEAEYEKTQLFMSVVHTLASERRLTRCAFLARRAAV